MQQQSLLPHADVITGATHVRTTLLQASLRSVRRFGNFQRWEAFIDPLYRDTILEAIAPAWLPIEVGLAHYRACDRFGLDDDELDKIGQGTGEKLQGTLLGVASKLARSAGVTPEAMAQCFGKLWPRLCMGGSCQFTAPRPGEIVVELRSAVLTKSRYFRGNFPGHARAGAQLIGQTISQIKMLPYDESVDRFTMQVSYT